MAPRARPRLLLVRAPRRLGQLFDEFRRRGWDLDHLMRVLPGGWTREIWCRMFSRGGWHLWEIRDGFRVAGYVAVTAHHGLEPNIHFACEGIHPVRFAREAQVIISAFRADWGRLAAYIPCDRPQVQRLAMLLGAEQIEPGVFVWATCPA